jgi:hypothetical protein
MSSDRLLASLDAAVHRDATLARVMACAAAAAALCLSLAGCGGSTGPQTVQVSLTAPTAGSTIVVSQIRVIGTVAPALAVVVVDGRRVHVWSGNFAPAVDLRRGVNRVRIVARAAGYRSAVMDVAVRYRPAGNGGASPGRSFTARANAICARLASAITALPAGLTRASALSDLAKLDPLTRAALARLQRVNPPPAAAADYATFLGILERTIVLNSELLSALNTGATGEVRQLTIQELALGRQDNAITLRLGLGSCDATPIPSA